MKRDGGRLLPRERMIKAGPESLSVEELVAIVLRTGKKGKHVLELSKDLLERFDGSLIKLSNAGLEEIASVEGVGMVKAITLKAALELGKRLHRELERIPEKLDSSVKVYRYCQEMVYLEREIVKVICLDTKLNVIGENTLTVGTSDRSLIHPRDVFRTAIRANASGVIVVHNHPSGDPTPSKEDRLITERLKQAGEILGVSLVDHVIVSRRGYFSFREEGEL
ncbi:MULTISPECIES: RadC family protein [unclassified Thermotoga]|uniref:RadC family protein n=1 Tax=unclassified Thermotoga TaxID=2631113 RepID=UPI00056F7DED|nr:MULTISPECIES: DNA repair protein RadC [unclassified Thermotoga]